MARAGFAYQPLRGYLPYGELEISLDRFRSALGIEIPFWEGSDRPFAFSVSRPGAVGQRVRPDLTNGPYSPNWNTSSGSFKRGRSFSGHAACRVFVREEFTLTGRGFTYADVLSPEISTTDFSVLLVGTNLVALDPGYVHTLDFYRTLWSINDGLGSELHTLEYSPLLERLRYSTQSGTATLDLSPTIYGERVSILVVQGEEGGSIPGPRLYVGFQDGRVERADFGSAAIAPLVGPRDLQLFLRDADAGKERYCGGGVWEYFALFFRAFEEPQARWLLRNPTGLVGWDPYVSRRAFEPREFHSIAATPLAYPRISARPSSSGRVSAAPTIFERVSARPRNLGPRVAADPATYARVSAKIRISNQEVTNVQATALCPKELNWEADNVLELADVLDEMQDPAAEITSADEVTCEIYDRETGDELTAVSPVTLSQVGSTNHWRESVLVNAANGFTERMRLKLVFLFDGGVGLQGRFVAFGVVASATS